MAVCAKCGRESPSDVSFCACCGSALLPTGTPAREERKVVSVVFVDLVGSTARAERLDPEDVRAVLGPFHERVRRELERFGGTVEKFIGDAIVAVFGAPLAHETDPVEARGKSRPGPGADHLAAGALSAIRRGRRVLGAR